MVAFATRQTTVFGWKVQGKIYMLIGHDEIPIAVDNSDINRIIKILQLTHK